MRKGEFGDIRNAVPNKAGIKAIVSETTGACPLMDIAGFPKDIDYTWYIKRAHKILQDVGYYPKPEQMELF